MTTEEWRDIPGYEGYYQVSNFGDIRRLHRNCGTLMHQHDFKGYRRVEFRIKGERVKFRVHRLVAQAFIPNPENKPFVNHIDEDKSNNHVNNLEWVTEKENVNHGTALKRRSEKRKKPIIGIDKGGVEHSFSSAREAAKITGASYKNISAVLHNKRNRAGGYKWKFAN